MRIDGPQNVRGLAFRLLITFLFALLVFLSIVTGPKVIYQLRSPLAADECAKVQPGMTTKELINLFERATPPVSLRYWAESQTLTLSRGDGQCTVTLDSQSKASTAKYEPRSSLPCVE